MPSPHEHLPWCTASTDIAAAGGAWRGMTPHEARLAASTARTCLSATGGYGPWNSSDHACWVRAPNLGNGSSELMYQPPHCSLPVVGAASHGTARGHIRFVGDSVSMQHARSFACFREPQCGTTVDGWGVVVQGVCALVSLRPKKKDARRRTPRGSRP